jgi:hypothetical protein
MFLGNTYKIPSLEIKNSVRIFFQIHFEKSALTILLYMSFGHAKLTLAVHRVIK